MVGTVCWWAMWPMSCSFFRPMWLHQWSTVTLTLWNRLLWLSTMKRKGVNTCPPKPKSCCPSMMRWQLCQKVRPIFQGPSFNQRKSISDELVDKLYLIKIKCISSKGFILIYQHKLLHSTHLIFCQFVKEVMHQILLTSMYTQRTESEIERGILKCNIYTRFPLSCNPLWISELTILCWLWKFGLIDIYVDATTS